MTDVLLIYLHLHNFKGVKDFTLSTGGNDVSIFGDNATGKTTLADACWWLLGGKDSDGRSDFELKRLDEDGTPEHHLDHEVEGVFLIGDQKKTLKKVYKEKWTKRRGATEREFDGHTTDYFHDGVPVTAGEFGLIVAEIASAETMRLLTDPYQFAAALHWKERRGLLLDVCGDVSDEDVITSDKALIDLPDVLEGRTLDDHRKVVNARRKQINEELDKLPVRIDEAERALPDISELPSEDECATDLLRANNTKHEAEQDLARIEAGGQVAEKTKELREVEAAIQTAKNVAAAEEAEQKKALRTERDEVADNLRTTSDHVKTAKLEAESSRASVERLADRMDERRVEWKLKDAETFEHEEPDTCAACGQSLPEDQVEAATQKALEAFNAKKADQLAGIAHDGQRSKEEHDALVGAAETRQKVIEEAEEDWDGFQREHEGISHRLLEITVEPDLGDLVEQKEAIEQVITELQTDSTEEIDRAKEAIDRQGKLIERVRVVISDYGVRERGMVRITELRGQEKTMATEFEELERQLHLMDLFVRVKVDMLTDQINARFKLARFKLFNILVNGGIEECCEVSFGGVPWGNLNHGAQINTGLDIITTLQEHFGVSLPVWVDQSESITKLPELSCQLIRLVVSPDDQSLRVTRKGE